MKELLDKREFDARILKGKPGDEIKVQMTDKRNEKYAKKVRKEERKNF